MGNEPIPSENITTNESIDLTSHLNQTSLPKNDQNRIQIPNIVPSTTNIDTQVSVNVIEIPLQTAELHITPTSLEKNDHKEQHHIIPIDTIVENQIPRTNSIEIESKKTKPRHRRRSIKRPAIIPRVDAIAALTYRNEISEYITLPKPIFIFVIFVLMALAHSSTSQLFLIGSALQSNLIPSGTDAITADTTIKFNNIGGVNDCYNWFTGTLFPAIFITTDSNGNSLSPNQFGRIALFNQLLGGIEIETTYRLDHSDVSKSNFLYLDQNLQLQQAIDQISYHQTRGEWINSSIASLIVTIATYNEEVSIYGVTTLTIEFQQGGYVQGSQDIALIPSSPYKSSLEYVYDGIFLMNACVLCIEFVRNMKNSHRRQELWLYLSAFWTVLDLATLLGYFATITSWVYVVHNVSGAGFLKDLNDIEKRSFMSSNELHVTEQRVLAILKMMGHEMIQFQCASMYCCLLLTIRILKHLRFHPKLGILTRTVGLATRDLGAFFAIFFIVYIAFVISGCLLFGSQVYNFSSLSRSGATCVNMLFGNFDFSSIEQVNNATAVVFYWSYMISMVLVLLNMMLAIIMDTYANVKSVAFENNRSIYKEISILLMEKFRAIDFSKMKALRTWQDVRNLNVFDRMINYEDLLQSLDRGGLQSIELVTCDVLCGHFKVSPHAAMATIRNLQSFVPTSNPNSVELNATTTAPVINSSADTALLPALESKVHSEQKTFNTCALLTRNVLPFSEHQKGDQLKQMQDDMLWMKTNFEHLQLQMNLLIRHQLPNIATEINATQNAEYDAQTSSPYYF